jgi:hypothetical protein
VAICEQRDRTAKHMRRVEAIAASPSLRNPRGRHFTIALRGTAGPSPYSSSGGKFMSRMRRESAGAMANPKATEKAVQTARILMMITPACPRACPATELQDAFARQHGYCPPWRTISKPVVTLNAFQKAPEKYLVKCLSRIGWCRFADRVGAGSSYIDRCVRFGAT